MKLSIDEIKANLEFAAEVMKRMPKVKVQGYICTWPKFCEEGNECEFSDHFWLEPLPAEIAEMEKILEWLKFTTLEKRRVVWLRACGMGWKRLSYRYKKSRSTLCREYISGLNDIKNALVAEFNSEK